MNNYLNIQFLIDVITNTILALEHINHHKRVVLVNRYYPIS